MYDEQTYDIPNYMYSTCTIYIYLSTFCCCCVWLKVTKSFSRAAHELAQSARAGQIRFGPYWGN